MRKIILAIIGFLIVAGTVFLGDFLIEKNKKKKPNFKKSVKTAFVEEIENRDVPIILSESGSLVAVNKIDIFSEVQGVFESSNKSFKPGSKYYKGQTLLTINSDEFLSSIKSQRSNLFNLITSILPDIRLDYSSDFTKWESYLQSFNVDSNIPKLPQFSSDKEKYFISGKGILTAYYNVKNLEVRLSKHKIKAPFNGVLTEALVTSGSLVRAGQKLGEFIDTSLYEMEISINSEFADLIKVGNNVSLTNSSKTKTYEGKVIRINGKIDQVSQTVKVYIDVKHPDLKEGMFLEANLVAKSVANATEVSRKLLVDNNLIYTVVNDSILVLKKISPVYFGSEKVVVKGLENGDKVLTQNLPGSFDGMIVKMNKK